MMGVTVKALMVAMEKSACVVNKMPVIR
jgi:hypothetical protein